MAQNGGREVLRDAPVLQLHGMLMGWLATNDTVPALVASAVRVVVRTPTRVPLKVK